MLSLARLEDIRIVKQFSRAQILGAFCQVIFDARTHEAQVPPQYSPSFHLAWIPGMFKEVFRCCTWPRHAQGATREGCQLQSIWNSLTLWKSSAACQDSLMESEMRFWPQRLTTLGRNSISHKWQFWRVLVLLHNCDACSGNNKLSCYYMTTETSMCLVPCAGLKTWAVISLYFH